MLKNYFDPEGFKNVLTPITLIGRTGDEYGFIVPVYAAADVLNKGGCSIPVFNFDELSYREQIIQEALDEDESDE
jgi:hypothetical protein